MKLLGLPWWAWGLLCLVVAGIYTVVTPRQPLPGMRGFLQRWGHALAWLLFAAACFGQSFAPQWSRPLALTGLATYLAFLTTLL